MTNLSLLHQVPIIALFFLFGIKISFGQSITEVATRWQDALDEWELIEDGYVVGTVQLRWANSNDWTSWTFNTDYGSGQFKTKWDGQFDQWELTGSNQRITAKAIWRNDFSQWRIDSGTNRFDLKKRYPTSPESDWIINNHPAGKIKMEQVWSGDPRSWNLDFPINNGFTFEEQVCMVFLVIINSITTNR